MSRSNTAAQGALGLLLTIGLCCFSAVSPAGAQQGWDNPPGSDKPSTKLNIDPGRDPYTAGMQSLEKGDYDRAIKLLGGLAAQGRGFEIAQMELGNAFIMKGRTQTDATAADIYIATGIGWILRAASNGLGAADTRLVKLYLDGEGIPIDAIEAARWYLLWHRSPTRMQIGSSQFDVSLEQRLKSSLRPIDWKEAQRRADLPLTF